jgi:hypothetical protein
VDFRAQLLAEGLALLTRLRAQPSEWQRVAFTPRGKLGHDRADLHAAARLQLAWAIQHDSCPKDADLLRFALAEEVKWRAEDPQQGIGETLEILAGIIASERSFQDVWTLARAKRANFDTACGFDIEHAFAAGVAETLAYVRGSRHQDRDQVLELLTPYVEAERVTEEHVAAWLSRAPGRLPTERGQNADVWFDRALVLKRSDAARAFLDEWVTASPPSTETSRALVWKLEQLECWPEASAARRQLFQQSREPFERASQACAIARAERIAGAPGVALAWLETAASLHAEHPKWRELGLARHLVEECFRCAASLGLDHGEDAFALADKLAAATPRLHLDAFQAAVEAAEKTQSPRLRHYQTLRDAEQARIADAMSRIRRSDE